MEDDESKLTEDDLYRLEHLDGASFELPDKAFPPDAKIYVTAELTIMKTYILVDPQRLDALEEIAEAANALIRSWHLDHKIPDSWLEEATSKLKRIGEK